VPDAAALGRIGLPAPKARVRAAAADRRYPAELAYPGDRPDVTQFSAMIDQLRGQYEAVDAAAGAGEMTVVFDAGQNSEANFAHLAGTGCTTSGPCPPRTGRT
jgi:hypothetical protein